MKLIYLQWADATSPSNVEHSWWYLEDALEWAEKDSYWVEQVGWLLKETKEYIFLCGQKSTTKTGDDLLQYGQIFKIPKTWIRKRVDLTKHVK